MSLFGESILADESKLEALGQNEVPLQPSLETGRGAVISMTEGGVKTMQHQGTCSYWPRVGSGWKR